MFDQITDGVHFVTALILSVIIWGLCLAVAWFYHFSEARRYSWHNNSLADFMDLIQHCSCCMVYCGDVSHAELRGR